MGKRGLSARFARGPLSLLAFSLRSKGPAYPPAEGPFSPCGRGAFLRAVRPGDSHEPGAWGIRVRPPTLTVCPPLAMNHRNPAGAAGVVVSGPVALAARWRADAVVFRRHGALARARMLEHLADELEAAAGEEAETVVDLAAAVKLTGFTRGHLRRMYREGRLAIVGGDEAKPRFRAADLPRKPAPATHPRNP